MLLKTYERILDYFRENQGYACFEELKNNGITVPQINELLERGDIERFAPGCYWCRVVKLKRPKECKYIEIAKANPEAVICLTSACYLQGLLEKEPEVVTVATKRTDRKIMEMSFDIDRHYFANTGIKGEIDIVRTKYGPYYVYGRDRTMCDCIRLRNSLDPDIYKEITGKYLEQHDGGAFDKLMSYASKLHASKPVLEFISGAAQSGQAPRG